MKTNRTFKAVINHITHAYGNKALIFFLYLMFSGMGGVSQSYTKLYYPYATYDYPDPGAYIIQKFTPTTHFNFEGTIMIQRVVESGSGKDPIQITLVDQDGIFQKAFLVFKGDDGEFVPTCASYNPNTETYCIAGINTNSGITGSPTCSWFLILDQDLNYLDAQRIGIGITGNTGYANFFVTDITTSTVEDFVYVGVAGNAMDPSPNASSASTMQKTIFVGGVIYTGGAVTFPSGRLFDMTGTSPTSWNINNQYFPSRIIEIPMANPDGGMLITGSSPDESIFFTRTDYHFSNNGTTELYDDQASDPLFAGDLYFDPVEDEVWFAGTKYKPYAPAFIYQKLTDLTLTGITLLSGLPFLPTNSFNQYENLVADDTSPFIKVSKILPTAETDEAMIAANTYESGYYNSPNHTNTYPSLHRMRYSSQAMKSFSSGSGTFPDLYTYPRYIGNQGVNNYLSYLSYNMMFYPSHTAHYFRYSVFNDETYVLGATCFDANSGLPPERIALNRTESTVINWCNYEYQPLYNSNIPTNNSSVAPTSLSYTLVGPDQLNFSEDITAIDLNDCIEDVYFKHSGAQLPQRSFENKFAIGMSASSFSIKTTMQSGGWRLYNMLGALVMKGSIENGYVSNDISSLGSGLYIAEILNNENKQIGTKKIIKD